MPKIVVIGAGIPGVSTAYALLERGYDVTVLDSDRYAAMETSFAIGGLLSASNTEVWNRWATILKGSGKKSILITFPVSRRARRLKNSPLTLVGLQPKISFRASGG